MTKQDISHYVNAQIKSIKSDSHYSELKKKYVNSLHMTEDELTMLFILEGKLGAYLDIAEEIKNGGK